MADFVAANEPWLISYSVYFSEDDRQMTVIHLHRDATSLDRHMEVAGPQIRQVRGPCSRFHIHNRIYGQPSEQALQRLRDKARMLGTGGCGGATPACWVRPPRMTVSRASEETPPPVCRPCPSV